MKNSICCSLMIKKAHMNFVRARFFYTSNIYNYSRFALFNVCVFNFFLQHLHTHTNTHTHKYVYTLFVRVEEFCILKLCYASAASKMKYEKKYLNCITNTRTFNSHTPRSLGICKLGTTVH